MREVFNIMSPWKVILLFPLLFLFALSQSYAMVVTLQWDPNTEPDLAGYMVYYNTGSSGPPYDSTVDVGNVTTYPLHGLTDGVTYFFVVSAYDTEGLESDYSNEVSTDTVATPGGSGGGDGGCLIATAAYSSPMSSKTNILCQFRDWYLKSNVLGKSLITLYEGSSPYLADITSKNEYLKVVVRLVLWPVVGVAYVMGNTTMEQKIMMLVIMVVLTYVMLKIFAIRARSTRL